MKFSDIEPFIRSGSYEIDVSLAHLKRTLKNWEEDYGVELNPDFQRGHVWTEEQQIAFVEFLLRGGGRQGLRNEIKVFGHYFHEFEGSLRIMQGLKFNVNGLKRREDVLKWYIQFNEGGTVHTKEEIDRVKELLREEQNKKRSER